MKANKNLILVFAALVSVFFASAHSLYLSNISLDFDKELKNNTIKAAQKFMNTNKKPVSFDLDKGLIMVQFAEDNQQYVEINPLGYQVYGMRDDKLRHSSGQNKYTKEQGLEIAKKQFGKIPSNIKSELVYDSDATEFDGTYFYKWFRYVDGIIAADEYFVANVDAVNGNIIAWRLAIFDYPKDKIDTVPAITSKVAGKVAELTYNAPMVDGFNPYIIIFGNKPVWVTKIHGQFYPYFVGIDAKDGSISFTGVLPGEIPKNYAKNDVQVIETEFIKNIYNSK